MIGLGTTISDIAAAIARMEGNPSGSNNNPGNLRAGTGQIGTDSRGFAIFPDVATGEAALEHQISLNVSRGLSLQTFFGGQRDAAGNVLPGGYPGYAPAADSNQPTQYAANVAGWLGISPDTPLSQVLDGSTSSDLGTGASTIDSWILFDTLDAGSAAGLSAVAWGALALGLFAVVLLIRK